MTITQVGVASTATQANATSVSITKPFGTQNGHVMLVQVVSNNQNVTAPSGWFEYRDSTVDVFRVQQFVKAAGPREPTAYTFSVAAATPLVGALTSWKGVDTADAVSEAIAATSLAHSEPFTTPTANGGNGTGTAGTTLFLRASRRVDSSPGSPITFSTTDSATEIVDVGVFSGGNVSYSLGLFLDDFQFQSASTHPGIPISASPGTADTHNVVTTIVLNGSPQDDNTVTTTTNSAENNVSSMTAGEDLTTIVDSNPGDKILGGGFLVATEFLGDTPPDGDWDITISRPLDASENSGREGWLVRLHAYSAVTTPVFLHAFGVFNPQPIVGD